MRSRPDATSRWFTWLVRKEWRELLASRSWWIFLALMGPLVGVGFISAVRTYGEASGLQGTALGVGEAFSPLIGIWAPTFSACELGAAFLLPFVAIRLVAADRQTGALRLELQGPASSLARIGAKTLVLLAGWLVATLAPLLGVGLWIGYGGHVAWAELSSVLLGHLLNAALTIALAAAAAAATEHPSTAAIATLSVTVGTWILSFIAAVQGGLWERVAGYTPTAMVAEFQHGLIRLSVVLVALVLVGSGLVLSAIWLRIGTRVSRRAVHSAIALAVAALLLVGSTTAFRSWDLSEQRYNSFSRSQEVALLAIPEPLRVTAYLAAEDPRRVDLERRAFSKLRRVLPTLAIQYVAATSIGLFEQTSEHYGEIHYQLGGKTAVSRSTTVDGVLETIYDLAGLPPAAGVDDTVYRGYPLAARPVGAAVLFYGVWPIAIGLCAWMTQRRRM